MRNMVRAICLQHAGGSASECKGKSEEHGHEGNLQEITVHHRIIITIVNMTRTRDIK